MKINESNVTIMVKDMDKAVNFYLNIGLTLKNRWENNYAQLKTTDIIVGLHPTDKDIPNNSKVSIGFMIDHIGDAKVLLDLHGIAFTYEEGKSGKYVHFHDPDGTTLYFSQPSWR